MTLRSGHLARHLVWVALAVLLLVMRGAEERRGLPVHRIVFLTTEGSAALTASFQRFKEAFASRHPQLSRQSTIQTLQLPVDSTELRHALSFIANQRPELLIAHTGAHAQAARKFAPQIRLVFSSYTDPRELGITSSLSRHPEPATGLWVNDELNGKRLELLLDAYAGLRVVAALGDADWYHGIGLERDEMRTLAAQRGVELRLLQAESVEHAMALVESNQATSVQGWCLPRTSLSLDGRLVKRLSALGKPVMAAHTPDVFEGAHLSYAYDRAYQPMVLADLAARVLRGESPASIPIQTPERFQLVVRMADDPRLPPLSPAFVRRADLVIR